MHLSNPLETIMRPAAANIVLALHRVDEQMTGRQIARVTGSRSASATLTTLRSLVGSGLLTAVPRSNGTYFSINKDHLLWPAIESAIGARTMLDDRIRAATAAGPDDTAVLLYGSTARSVSAPDSDVDLLVVYRDGISADARDGFTTTLADRIRAWTGNRAEVYDLTAAQLDRMSEARDPLVESWRRDAVLIAGSRPTALGHG